MTKLVQNDIASLTNEQSALAALNANSALLEVFSDNVLSRDGTTPNQMNADLDMNSNHILNLPVPLNASEPLRLQDLSDFLGTGVITVPHVPEKYAVDFGVVADGVTDNINALNSLKASLGTGGYKVVFPRGVISFSSMWDVSNLKNVIFEGQGGVDLTYSASVGTILKYTGGAGTGTIINMNEHRGIWWKDIQVVYVSNSFTGTIFNMLTSFTTGCASGFDNVQVYQVTNSGFTAGQAYYLRNNIDITWRNCYVSHCGIGWIGKFDGEAGHTNMIKLYNCTSIGIVSSAIVNPDTGWSCYGCNFELSNAGNPSGILGTSNTQIINLNLYSCVFADSTTNGTWINFTGGTVNFNMYGGAILTIAGTTTGILFNGGSNFNPTIMGVYFSGPTTCINASTAVTNAVILNNGFFTGTPISGTANISSGSIIAANQGLSSPLSLGAGGTGVAAGPFIYTYSFANVNMNSVADTTFTITLPSGYTRYRIQSVMISHASVDLTAATAVQYGLFTATGGGGTAIIAATTSTVSSTAQSTNNNAQFIGPGITASFNNPQLFFRVTTAHGSAATADVTLQIQPIF